jgi:cytochrome c-type biogenesis protein CcmH/NrfG
MPPVVVSPMEVRLAEFHAGARNFNQAAESYQAAIRRRPNDLASLVGYRDSLIRIGRRDEAEEVDKIISAVKK